MASVWKHPKSSFYMACFTAYVGQRACRLKKTTATKERRVAMRIADEIEQAATGARAPEKINDFLEGVSDLKARRAARKAFNEVLRLCTGKGLNSKTTRGFVDNWLERTRGEVSAATYTKYTHTRKLLLESLGSKADQDISAVKQDDIVRFRDDQAKRVATATANIALKIVRMIFAAAEADGLLTRNEAKYVKKLKSRGETVSRRAFTMQEMKQILASCNDEWRSLVLFGFYTGARLGDLAMLTWQNIDLEAKELRYASRKTGRTIVTPLAGPLFANVEKLPAGDDPKQPVHPRAFKIVSATGRTGTLSRQFGEIMADAGLVAARSRHTDEKEKKGRATRREISEISFHALRHTAVSLLKSAGVTDAIARDLVGHESEEVSRLYTHIEDKAKREAVNKLPDLE